MDIEKKYTLNTACSKKGLQITVKDSKTNLEYQCLITNSLQQLKAIKEWFDQLVDLAHHLSNQSGHQFDLESKKLKILVKHPTKASKIIEAMVLAMKQKVCQAIYNPKDIEKIIQVCESQKQVSNIELKKMVLSLADAIQATNNKKQTIAFQNNEDNIRKICTEQFNHQIANVKQKFSQAIKQTQRNQLKIVQLQQELKQKDEVIDTIIKKIQNFSKDSDQRIDKVQDRVEACQVYFKNSITKMLSAEAFIDENSFSIKRVLINGNQIVKIKDDEADIFSKIKIKNKRQFSIRVDSLKQWMCIGIADATLKVRQSFSNEPNCVGYYSDGNFYNGSTLSGRKYKIYEEGDIINVNVDLEIGKIDWVIDGQLRISFTYQKIKDKNIQWVPYIWLYSNGDQISIIK